jgi:hypothetical protein
MTTTDSVFQSAVSNMLTEIFDGPPGQEAYLLNPGDPGLLRQLDTIDARGDNSETVYASCARPMTYGKNGPGIGIDVSYRRLGNTGISAEPIS